MKITLSTSSFHLNEVSETWVAERLADIGERRRLTLADRRKLSGGAPSA